MANKLTPAQRNLVVETLNLDKACNYSRLEYYLQQIISGHDVTFETRSSKPFTVSSQEAWSIIVTWAQNEGNLPIGDRKDLFNMRSRATKLLDYLQTNVSGKTAEAAASYQLILDQAHNEVDPVFPSQDPQDYNIQRIYDLRRLQVNILQAGIIGKIYTNLEKSNILAGVPAESRAYVLRMFAAGSQNFRYNPADPTKNFTPEKIHQLLLHTPGVQDVNSIIRLFYSNAAQEDIQSIVETIESSIQEYGESQYQKEMEIQRNLTTLSPSLGSVSYLVNSLDAHATPAEKIALIRNLKSQIVSSASGNHQSGETLLKAALKSAGFPVPQDLRASAYKSFLPYLEELEIKERHLLLGSELSERDSRLLATKNLAKKIGIDLETPWYSKRDLDQMSTKLAGDKSFQEAFDLESAKGDRADLSKLTRLSDLMGKHHDYKTYHNALDGNLWYRVRDVWDKGTGRFQAVKQPINRFAGKLWTGYDKINDFVFTPVNRLAQWWEQQQEKRPWLNPVLLITNGLIKYQTNLAIKIHTWALGVDKKRWFSFFARNVADFSEGFIKHKANWGDAGSFFTQRKIGNVLDWGIRTISRGKQTGLKSLKITIANTLWSGFSKMAPQLSAKMMAGALSKTITTFLAGELTLGVSLAIQVGWEAIKSGSTLLAKAIKSMFHGDASNLYGAIPALLLALNSVFAGIPGAIIVAVDLLKKALKLLWDGFIFLLGLAAIVTGIVLTFVVLLWFGILSPNTFILDSEYQPPASAADLGPSVSCMSEGSVPDAAAPGVATRAREIIADLHTGFWKYCNRPTNPEQSELYFGVADIIAVPSVYNLLPANRPSIFDYELFKSNPDPTREEIQVSGNALYWCTYLVQHSYRESGKTGLSYSLWSPTLEDEFSQKFTFIEGSVANSGNVKPGDVIFFKVLGGPDRTNHVGIINNVDPPGFTYYQSNAPTINSFGSFNGGAKDSSLGVEVVGFGRI